MNADGLVAGDKRFAQFSVLIGAKSELHLVLVTTSVGAGRPTRRGTDAHRPPLRTGDELSAPLIRWFLLGDRRRLVLWGIDRFLIVSAFGVGDSLAKASMLAGLERCVSPPSEGRPR